MIAWAPPSASAQLTTIWAEAYARRTACEQKIIFETCFCHCVSWDLLDLQQAPRESNREAELRQKEAGGWIKR